VNRKKCGLDSDDIFYHQACLINVVFLRPRTKSYVHHIQDLSV